MCNVSITIDLRVNWTELRLEQKNSMCAIDRYAVFMPFNTLANSDFQELVISLSNWVPPDYKMRVTGQMQRT